VDSDVEWMEGPRDSSANEDLFSRVKSVYFFITQTFTPSAIAMSLTRGGIKVWMLSRNVKFACGDNKIISN